MPLIPYERLVYRTNRSPREIRWRLKQLVEPNKALQQAGVISGNFYQSYYGGLNGDSFVVKRKAFAENDSIVVMNGTLTEHFGGTHIDLTLKLRLPVQVVVVLGVGGALVVGIFQSYTALAQRVLDFATLTPFVIALVIYVVAVVGFSVEGAKTKAMLVRYLSIRPVSK